MSLDALAFVKTYFAIRLYAEFQTLAYSDTVVKMIYLGDRNDYRIVLGDDLGIRVQTDGKLRFSEGEQIKVRLPVSLCRVIVE